MTTFIITAGEVESARAARLQLIDLGDEKTAATLAWATTLQPAGNPLGLALAEAIATLRELAVLDCSVPSAAMRARELANATLVGIAPMLAAAESPADGGFFSAAGRMSSSPVRVGSNLPVVQAEADPDPADIIAGALQTSRAHAYELMRAAIGTSGVGPELEAWRKLRDPNVLHVNLLRGFPAKLSVDHLRHLAGAQADAPAAESAPPTEEQIAAECKRRWPSNWQTDHYPFKAGVQFALSALSATRAVAPVAEPVALTDEQWLPIESAPRDGTLLRLLVDFEHHATEDQPEPSPTIGANSLANTGIDEWQFAGWNWEQDCFTQGIGKPVGWLPMLAPSPVSEAAQDKDDAELLDKLEMAVHFDVGSIRIGVQHFLSAQSRFVIENAEGRELGDAFTLRDALDAALSKGSGS